MTQYPLQSTMTPLDGAGEQRSSPIRPSIKGPMSESPLDGEDLVRYDVNHDQRRQIQELEEGAHLANKRLKQAQDEHGSESTNSPLKSKSTSSPNSIHRKLPNHNSDGENNQGGGWWCLPQQLHLDTLPKATPLGLSFGERNVGLLDFGEGDMEWVGEGRFEVVVVQLSACEGGWDLGLQN
jgi:hypothetical protein